MFNASQTELAAIRPREQPTTTGKHDDGVASSRKHEGDRPGAPVKKKKNTSSFVRLEKEDSAATGLPSINGGHEQHVGGLSTRGTGLRSIVIRKKSIFDKFAAFGVLLTLGVVCGFGACSLGGSGVGGGSDDGYAALSPWLGMAAPSPASPLTAAELHAIFTTKVQELRPQLTPSRTQAFNQATRFSLCTAHEHFPWSYLTESNGVSTVQSAAKNPSWVYVDNTKAASTSIRKLLSSVLGVSWESWAELTPNCKSGQRTTSKCLTEEEVESAFVFSVVRHPLDKLLSGIRQLQSTESKVAYRQAVHLAPLNLTARDVLEYRHPFFNEHVVSSSKRFAASSQSGRLLTFDAIVKLEEFENGAWPWLMQQFPVTQQLREQLTTGLGHHNSKSGSTNLKSRGAAESPTSLTDVVDGSALAIDVFCSWHVWDYLCFDYELPPECADHMIRTDKPSHSVG